MSAAAQSARAHDACAHIRRRCLSSADETLHSTRHDSFSLRETRMNQGLFARMNVVVRAPRQRASGRIGTSPHVQCTTIAADSATEKIFCRNAADALRNGGFASESARISASDSRAPSPLRARPTTASVFPTTFLHAPRTG
jgi:hypothetical protein